MARVGDANDPDSVSGMLYTVSQAEIQLERDAMQFICMQPPISQHHYPYICTYILTFLRLLLPKAEMKPLQYEK